MFIVVMRKIKEKDTHTGSGQRVRVCAFDVVLTFRHTIVIATRTTLTFAITAGYLFSSVSYVPRSVCILPSVVVFRVARFWSPFKLRFPP